MRRLPPNRKSEASQDRDESKGLRSVLAGGGPERDLSYGVVPERPRISRTFRFLVISAGVVPRCSSHLVNSAKRTVCSVGTLLTETVTVSRGRPMPATHSLPRRCLRPRATAS